MIQNEKLMYRHDPDFTSVQKCSNLARVSPSRLSDAIARRSIAPAPEICIGKEMSKTCRQRFFFLNAVNSTGTGYFSRFYDRRAITIPFLVFFSDPQEAMVL